MASSRVSTAITWSSSASVTISSATAVASDAFTFNVEDWDAAIEVNADNSSTPASGDYVDVFVAYTAGDVLGDSGNDYDTVKHATPLGRLNTYSTEGGEDPARATFPILGAPLGFQLILSAPNAGTRNVVCRAMVVTHRPQ